MRCITTILRLFNDVEIVSGFKRLIGDVAFKIFVVQKRNGQKINNKCFQ